MVIQRHNVKREIYRSMYGFCSEPEKNAHIFESFPLQLAKKKET